MRFAPEIPARRRVGVARSAGRANEFDRPSASHHMARPRPRTQPQSSLDEREVSGSPAARLLETAVATLVFLRLLTPPEGSALGRTLWISTLWFAAAFLAAWFRLRDGTLRRRFDLLDAGVFVLTAGHVLSGLRLIVLHDGDRRSALNMMWEWAALAVSFVLLRSVLGEPGRRAAWQRMSVALAVSFAGLGIWQHYVMYRSEAQSYDALRSEYDELIAPSSASPSPETIERRERRLGELRQEFSRMRIPMEGAARRQFEDRLRGSTEPIGLFALANTFAGWLAVWLLVGCGMTIANPLTPASGKTGRRMRWVAIFAMGIIAFCLVLTKSRTAWVGTVAGIVTWGVLARRSSGRRNAPKIAATETPSSREGGETESVGVGSGTGKSKPLVLAAALSAAVAAAAGLAWVTGGLDREVVAQAPRSLKFRLQYWTGAAKVVRERWFWGTGPGNFRPHYLKYKLPEASEEIADPHNIVLDVWTSGGFVALCGLALTLIAGARVFVPPGRAGSSPHSTEAASSAPAATRSSSAAGPLGRGVCMAFVMMLATILFFGGDTDEFVRMTSVAAGCFIAWRVLRVFPHAASQACLAGSAAALFVHLLGAGGAEMPAVMQCLLLVVALGAAGETQAGPTSGTGSRTWPTLSAAAALVLCVACILSAALPTMSSEALMATGDADVARDGIFAPAERFYQKAAVTDPLSPLPLERLTELLWLRSKQRPDRMAQDDSEAAVAFGEMVIALDPHDAHGYRRLGSLWQTRATRSGAQADAKTAVRWFDEAVARYPNLAELRAERAEALATAGDVESAAREAEAALELDAVNRREGHADRVLDELTQQRLKTLSARTR